MPAILSLAFVLSGAAALVFEMAWFHRAGLVFGNGVVAVTVVLSSFMAGLAIGNAFAAWIASRTRRLLPVYAALELAIAISGIALTAVLPQLSRTNVPLVVAFVLLLVPASAMGATLPVLVAAQSDLQVRLTPQISFRVALGTLYAANTVGGLIGVLAAEFALVPTIGIAGSALIAGLLNVSAGAIALWVAGRVRPGRQTPESHVGVSLASDADKPVLLTPIVCAALAGFAMLALEVIWFRFLSLFILTTTETISEMLAVVLGGIALGGFAAARWLPGTRTTNLAASVAATGAAAAVTLSYFAFRFTTGIQIGAWSTIAWLALVLTLPASIASGALFTVVGALVRQRTPDHASAASTVTLANTIGAAFGPPIAAFVLLPTLGTERSLFALTLGYVAIAFLLLIRSGLRHVIVPIAAAVALAAVFPFGSMASYLERMADAYAGDGAQIVATREGPTESIALMQQRWMGQPVYHRLVTNGFSMSGTAIPGQRYMRYFVYWPMLVHTTPLQRILVVCYGAGVTAGAAVDVPTATTIDIVELSRDIVAMSDLIYAGERNPLRDPRVALHIEDGRHFLRTNDSHYDLITGEPPPPRSPGAVNLYTREYFQLLRDRLADGGIATYWVPVARPHPGTDVDTIVRAFCDVFDDCSLWNATPFDFMLVGTRGGGRFEPSRFEPIRAKLAEIGFERPEQIGTTFLGDARFLRDLTAATPPLTDDFPERLRPSARPSLSDPRYPDDRAVVAEYQGVIDPSSARDRFARSSVIAAWWPSPLRDATLGWFDEQRAINRVLWEGGKPLRLIDELDAALTRTPLRTLPLWILDSDAVKQRIAATGNDGSGTVEYLRGAQLLADREYERAASYFGLAERRGLQTPAIRPLIAYTLCKAGRIAMASQVMESYRPRDEDGRRFVEWMKTRCVDGKGE